jgi:hypothetical protein
VPTKLPGTGAALAETPQRPAFMQSDVSGFIAFDFVLRLLFARVMDVAFIIHIFGVHAHDFAAHPAGFRIPTYMIADFKPLGHGKRP